MKSENIIFIHGWASGPYAWFNQASFFKKKFNVYTPGLLGYGRKDASALGSSSDISSSDMFANMAGDIKNFINENKLRDICLVGWSLGGMVSLKLAAELKDKINHLVLIGTTPRFVKSEDFKCAVSKELVDKIYNNMKKDFSGTLKWFFRFCFSSNERARNEFGEVLKVLGDVVVPLNQNTLLTGLKMLTDLDITYLLDDVKVPSMIIHGRDDRVCPPEAAQFLAKRLNAKLNFIEKAGHAPFLTQPGKVNALIENFIK